MTHCYAYVDYTNPVIVVTCVQQDIVTMTAVFWNRLDADTFARSWLDSHKNHDPYVVTHDKN